MGERYFLRYTSKSNVRLILEVAHSQTLMDLLEEFQDRLVPYQLFKVTARNRVLIEELRVEEASLRRD